MWLCNLIDRGAAHEYGAKYGKFVAGGLHVSNKMPPFGRIDFLSAKMFRFNKNSDEVFLAFGRKLLNCCRIVVHSCHYHFGKTRKS